MMWPFTRKIVIELRLDEAQLTSILRTIRPPAPLLADEPPKPKVPEHELKFEAWIAEQGFPETRASHYRGAFAVVTGKRAVPQGYTRKELQDELASLGAPLPL